MRAWVSELNRNRTAGHRDVSYLLFSVAGICISCGEGGERLFLSGCAHSAPWGVGSMVSRACCLIFVFTLLAYFICTSARVCVCVCSLPICCSPVGHIFLLCKGFKSASARVCVRVCVCLFVCVAFLSVCDPKLHLSVCMWAYQ